MNVTNKLGNLTVREAMSLVVITAAPTDKISNIALIFSEKSINAVCVVDSHGRCIGIFTSHDLARYESQLEGANARIDHGISYDLAHYNANDDRSPHGVPFDEIGRHMSTCLQTIGQDEPISTAAQIMSQQKIHHLVALDDNARPSGILSSLDILAKLFEHQTTS